MGRPRSVFLDVELPAGRDARRKILKNLYNKNRNLSLNYLKVFFSTYSESEWDCWVIGSGSILKVLVTFQQDKARKPIQLQQKHQYQKHQYH